MTIKFKQAKRSGTHLLLGLAGPSGSGKTLSALRIARGMVGDDSKIFVIDTEAGRALHYACAEGEEPGGFRFAFQHGELNAPFSPQAYGEALAAAVKAGAEVVIVDSASHEHEGPGGILEMHTVEHQRMGNKESTKFAAWIKPKAEHNKYVNSLLQTKAHLIFCFRAKDKMAMVKNEKGKMEPVSLGWTAICPDRMEYEMADLLILPPGCEGRPDLSLGKVYHHHRGFFPAQLDEKVGENLAAWAAGGETDAGASSSQDVFDHFEDLLSRDLTAGEIKEIGAEIAAQVELLSGDHYTEIRKLYADVLAAQSKPADDNAPPPELEGDPTAYQNALDL